jgi:3-hydroxyacyl-[acyl-carrier-protein] dehydratase
MSIFLNKLYRVEEKENDIVKVLLNPEHEIFVGHFPNNPILPGVCIVQMIKEIQHQLVISKIEHIRYYHPINPNITRRLIFSFEREKINVKIFDEKFELLLATINKIYYENEKNK